MGREITVTIETSSAGVSVDPGESRTVTLYRDGDPVPAEGDPGTAGDDGWSPILSVITDDDRRVLQVTDWTGGEGTKPAVGGYIGADGLVVDIADAVDIRGAQGLQGEAGADGADGAAGADYATILTELGDQAGPTLTLDMQGNSARNRFTATATGNLAIAFANVPAGVQSITLDLTAGGDHIVTYPASVKLPADGAPELTSDTDVLVFETVDGGTTWKLFAAGEGYS